MCIQNQLYRENKVENIVTIRKGSKEVSGSRLKKTGVPEAVFYCPFCQLNSKNPILSADGHLLPAGRKVVIMLTLQELKQVVSNREERRKVPSAKYLRENEVAVAKQRLMDCAEIIAYQTGYVLYCVGDYATVFPLFTCRDYVYEAERKIAVVEENFFDDQPWYVRLILEGEDRLWRNRETREHNNCVSYSCISEEWCELADKGQCLLEKIIAEETVRELMDLLTERQRQMIQRIYFQQKTQKEVSHELGITVPAVSKCISQAMQKMRNNSDNSARALEKGDWKYAW